MSLEIISCAVSVTLLPQAKEREGENSMRLSATMDMVGPEEGHDGCFWYLTKTKNIGQSEEDTMNKHRMLQETYKGRVNKNNDSECLGIPRINP